MNVGHHGRHDVGSCRWHEQELVKLWWAAKVQGRKNEKQDEAEGVKTLTPKKNQDASPFTTTRPHNTKAIQMG